jgi:hypothetical protein
MLDVSVKRNLEFKSLTEVFAPCVRVPDAAVSVLVSTPPLGPVFEELVPLLDDEGPQLQPLAV